MRVGRIVLTGIMVAIAIGCAAKDRTSDIKQVQDDVRKIFAAMSAGDVDTTVWYTYPSLIEAQGGSFRAKEKLREQIAEFQSKDLKRESLEFPTTPIFLESDNRDYVIVPTYSIFSSGNTRTESLSYQLGTRRKGTHQWKYIDGKGINKRSILKIFPEFPPDFEFPERHQMKLD